jgi:hypothetical protein
VFPSSKKPQELANSLLRAVRETFLTSLVRGRMSVPSG